MKRILASALVGLVASSAQAIELKLVAGDDRDADQEIEVALSETGLVSIYMTMFPGDGNVTFFIAFLDATPLGDREAAGYDVLGNIFKMQRNDGTRWFRNAGDSSSRNIEDYSLIAADDEGGNNGPGTNGEWEGVVDSIIIHGTELGAYDLYFENQVTADNGARPPGLYDFKNVQHDYRLNLRIPGFVWFKNAWVDPNAGFDVPFIINIIIPEPASLALLAAMSFVVMGRRRR